MPKRNSTLKPQPNITPTLRKSPRLHPESRNPPLDPKTPEPRSRACRFGPGHSPLGYSNKGFVKKVPKKAQETRCGSKNFGKMNNGLIRSGTEKSGVGLRRSPRLSGEVNVIDKFFGNEVSDRKERRGLSYLGKMEVKFDSGKGGITKRVTRSSIRDNSDEILKKKSICKGDLTDAERVIVGFDLGKQDMGKRVAEKRVTRGSVWGNADEISERRNSCKKGLSDAGRAKKGFDLGKRAAAEIRIEKKVTRGSIRGNADEITDKNCKGRDSLLDVERKRSLRAKSFNCSGVKLDNHTDEGSLIVGKTDVEANSCLDYWANLGKKFIHSCGADGVNVKVKDFNEDTKTIGVKRKRNQDGDGHGWTQEQELALQRAYFATKPTPNFWKRVAKLVPGKSAQDCFNKVHADNLTPPQARRRSRATNRNVSSFSLSASRLLKPGEPKLRRITSRKQKGCLAQKTVRQLLQNHYNVDQGYEADLFSVLESTFNSSTKSLACGVSYSTPQCEKCSIGLSKTCCDISSSALKKRFSRLSSSNGGSLVSPPVLKPVKNKALHEKYIDQLHCREAKRRVVRAKSPKKDFNQKTEAIEVLKNSLVLDAKDFIHKFQHGKDSAMREYSDNDDANEGLEEDDGEDEY